MQSLALVKANTTTGSYSMMILLTDLKCYKLHMYTPRGLNKDQALAKLTGCEDHLEGSSSYKEVQLKKFCLPVRTSCLSAENVLETPVLQFMCRLICCNM